MTKIQLPRGRVLMARGCCEASGRCFRFSLFYDSEAASCSQEKVGHKVEIEFRKAGNGGQAASGRAGKLKDPRLVVGALGGCEVHEPRRGRQGDLLMHEGGCSVTRNHLGAPNPLDFSGIS